MILTEFVEMKKGRVKVSDLLPGSNANVLCRCDKCGSEYNQRYCRDTDVCYTCRKSDGMKGNTHGSGNATETPPKHKIEAILAIDGNGKAEIGRQFGVNIIVVNRWLREHGIEIEAYRGLVKKIPDDFKEFYATNPSKEALYEKYGVSYPTIKRWLKDSDLVHVGVTSKKDVPPIDEMVALNATMTTEELAKHYKVSQSSIVVWFRSYGVSLKQHGRGTSKEETEFFNFLNSIYPGFVQGKKSILRNGYLQLDAYHPELKVAFEYDGLFWHANEDRKDHREKWDQCLEAGITLYRVHSMEWAYQRELVKSMIKVRLGKVDQKIHGRKLKALEITSALAKEFHEQNHISGYSGGAISFGLFRDDELISVMSFSKSRYDGGQEWEIARFSTIMNTAVVGGANKIFSAFVKAYRPQSVLTFSDLRWGRGGVYEKMGFKFVSRGAPTYWYYHPEHQRQRFSRMAFQKDKLESKLEKFDPALSEYQNMLNNRYYRYWDCGSDRYVWTK